MIRNVLSIAGSDPSGGAGIQADLKTFAARGVYGMAALTALTAQNTKGVWGVHLVPPEFVAQQIKAVLADIRVDAVKIGMIANADIAEAVADALAAHRGIPIVLDPVMIATSGARLLKPGAIAALQKELLPLAALATPNLDEAEILVGHPLTSVEDMRTAAKEIHARFGCAALVKGGHLRGLAEAVDIFYDGKAELLLTAPFVRGVSTHGTGCTYSAAITAGLAQGLKLSDAVKLGKKFITNAITNSQRVGKHFVLNGQVN